MKIRRHAYVNQIEEYVLDINEEYVEMLNAYFNYHFPEKEKLTLQDVIDLYLDNDHPRAEEKLEYKNSSYSQTLEEFIKQCIDEDIWDCDVEVVSNEVDGWEDEIVED